MRIKEMNLFTRCILSIPLEVIRVFNYYLFTQSRPLAPVAPFKMTLSRRWGEEVY